MGIFFIGDHVRANVFMTGCNGQDPNYRNPASPDNLGPLPPWENPRMPRPSTESSRVVTPTTPSSMTSIRTVVHTQSQVIPSRLQQASTMPSIPSSRSPSAPTSPTRARSTSDLHEKWKNQGQPFDGNRSGRNSILTLGIGGSVSSDQLNTSATVVGEAEEEISNSIEPSEPKQSRPAQWATLDELLDKLLFLAVSGDGMQVLFSVFESCFLLNLIRSNVYIEFPPHLSEICNSSECFSCHAETHTPA